MRPPSRDQRDELSSLLGEGTEGQEHPAQVGPELGKTSVEFQEPGAACSGAGEGGSTCFKYHRVVAEDEEVNTLFKFLGLGHQPRWSNPCLRDMGCIRLAFQVFKRSRNPDFYGKSPDVYILVTS